MAIAHLAKQVQMLIGNDSTRDSVVNHTGFPRDSMVSEPASLTGSVSS